MLLFNDLIKYIKSEVKRFQNISCYCLTTRDIKALADDTLFQNISCYCLTQQKLRKKQRKKYFKTSHVIV